MCPSCTGRRIANTAAAIVDRVLPDVPVRQYVLTFPYELRRRTAFKADVLTAIGRIAVEAIFASYRARAKRRGIAHGQCGAINIVQRFGSLNLHVHFHVVVLDRVFSRDAASGASAFGTFGNIAIWPRPMAMAAHASSAVGPSWTDNTANA